MNFRKFAALAIVACFSFIGLETMAQDDPPPPPPPPPPPVSPEPEKPEQDPTSLPGLDGESIVFVDEMPEFPGGQSHLHRYLIHNMRYPNEAREENITGTVYVEFFVEPTGEITDVKVKKSVHEALDAEAVRVIKGMPKWEPGKAKGEPVRTSMTLPIKFSLG